MSTFYQHAIICPTCGGEVHATLAAGVHASRIPELRDDLLARRFHRVTCSSCGSTTKVTASFVYTDFGRAQWILVGRTRDVAEWPAWERRLVDDVRQIFDRGSPLAHVVADRLRMRVVFGYEALREKLLVWDEGLDDGVVECVKLVAIVSDPRLGEAGSRLLLDDCDGASLHLNWFAPSNDKPSRGVITPAPWMDEAAASSKSLGARYPELFRGGLVSIDRYLRT